MIFKGCTWLPKVVYGCSWFYMVYMVVHLAIYGFRWLYKALHGCTLLYIVIKGCTWMYKVTTRGEINADGVGGHAVATLNQLIA